MSPGAAAAALARLLKEPEESLDLARSVLTVARLGTPSLEEDGCLAHLDALGRRAREVIGGAEEPRWIIAALNRVLFEEEGLRPNLLEFDDPRNSYLDRVLQRKTGIPITLSVIYMEVGRLAGVAMEGVGLPFHFIVRILGPGERATLVDPYNQGRILTPEDCARIVEEQSGGSLPFQPGFLRAVTKRQIVARVLTNLKVIHWKTQAWERALATVDLLFVVRADDPRELRDRGRLRLWTGRFEEAISDLEEYMERVPGAEDATEIRAEIRQAREGLSGTSRP